MNSSVFQEISSAGVVAKRLRQIAFLIAVALSIAVTSGCGDAGDAETTAASAAESAPPAEEGHEGHGHDEAAGESGDAHADHAGEGEHVDEFVLTPQAIRNNGIKVATAKSQPLTATTVAPARVAYNAEQIAHVGSVVAGRVKELKARIGDQVKKGDTLLIIDSPELGAAQSDYLQKRTTVEIAQPVVTLAKDAYDRAQLLYDESQGISLTEVQKRKGEHQAAQGNVLSASAALTAAENRLHLLGMSKEAVDAIAKTSEIEPTYIVRAPLDGRVIEREATLGELVGPDKERLLMLANLNPVWVFADVPEAKLNQVSVGSKTLITVPAVSGEPFEGKVSYVVPELDPSTRTARVRVEVPNEAMKLLPGMFATAAISAGEGAGAEAVVAVPEQAVQTVEGEPAVFVPVEGEPNTFAKRAVGIGPPIGGMVPVFAGLKEGERYVASGSFLLKAELGKAGAAHEH